ncbi:protein hairy [Schistocerca serialis cubense]|uniref:protein hairy n=1 Tax=Schistocerca serialis cubense TaxID=2023355 RepID=UPI00214F5521|nr:protein hairy [Schistocerca serialis cubense]
MVTGGPTAGPGPAPCVVTPAPTPPPGSAAAAAAAASTSPAPDVGGGPIAVQRRSASETRRSNKPIMEKRRRARINNCLNELKTLILDAMKKDPARHSKLEKADILEMTVKHLESLQRQQSAMAAATDPSVVNKFRAGFSECAGEVGRFPGLEANVRRRLLSHLASCLNGSAMAAQAATAAAQAASVHDQQQQQQPPNTAGVTGAPTQQVTAMPVTAAPTTATATAVQVHIVPAVGTSGEHATGPLLLTTAGAVSAGGLQLLPTRLPNGDIALVLPRSQLPQPQQQQQPSQQQQQQQQAQQQSTPTVLPTLVPIPTRTASTASAASSTSSMSSVSSASSSPSGSASGSSSASVSPVAFERLAVNSSPPAPPLVSPPAPTVVVAAPPMVSSPVPSTPSAPTSPVVLCRDVATSPANLYYQPRPYSPPMQKPLSLVVRKTAQPVEEEKPWRPW